VRWKFKDINFNQGKARQIDLANEIIGIYQAQHLKAKTTEPAPSK